jgi:predicted O-methyltransferase YrrM
MDLLASGLNDYLEQLAEPESALLQKINRETQLQVLMPRMLSGHYQGRVLSLLSKLIQPKCILEIGTFTGYATLCLAEGLSRDGIIHTIDINEELEDRVRAYFQESKHNEQINYHIGDALEILPQLDIQPDLVFIDADKKNNAVYYDMIFDWLQPGAVILIDNVLWSGKVLSEEKVDKDTSLIMELNEKIKADPRVEQVMLPIRDGLWIIRKK